MRMERIGDSSPHSSDLQMGTWIQQVNHWDYEESSLSGLNLESSRELESLVEDKDVASKAVAFVVHSTRKGIVPLCADVANLLRSKKQLQDKVSRLKKENERLRTGLSASVSNTSTTTASPPASIPSYSDRTSGSTPQAQDGNRRCSNSSFSSSNLSGSPKLEKYQQRSPRLHRTSAFTLPHDSKNSSSQQHLAVATVHYNPPNGVQPHVVPPGSGSGRGGEGGGHKPRGHERKDSLPQMVAVPHQDIPKVIPRVRLEDREVQCSLDPETNEKLEEQFRDTMRHNTSLAEELGAAKKEIEILRGRLKELEMTQLARQCLGDFYMENEFEGGSSQKKSSKSSQPVCPLSSKNPYQGIPLPRRTSPLMLEGPLDNCRCVNCDVAKKEKTRGSRPKLNVICDSQLREETGLCLHDHVVVKGDRTGFVRYIGHLDNVGKPTTIFIGLELDAPVGRHDGVFNGKRYFSCLREHGVMLPSTDIMCLITEKEPSACNSFRSGVSCGSTGSITTIHIGADSMPVPGPSSPPLPGTRPPAPPPPGTAPPGTLIPLEMDNRPRTDSTSKKSRNDKNVNNHTDKTKERNGKLSKKKECKRECKVSKFFRRRELSSANEKRFPDHDANLKLPRHSPTVAEDIV